MDPVGEAPTTKPPPPPSAGQQQESASSSDSNPQPLEQPEAISEEDLDNEANLSSIEARLDRALNEVSSLKVDNLATSLSQSLAAAVSSSSSISSAAATAATASSASSSNDRAEVLDSDMMSLANSLASDLADLVQSMNITARSEAESSSSVLGASASGMTPPSSKLLDLSLPTADGAMLPAEKSDSTAATSASPESPTVSTSCQSTSSQQQQATEDKKNSTNSSMSASDPNLTASEAANSLLETFAAVARRRSGASGGPGGMPSLISGGRSSASSVASTNSRNQAVSSAAAAAAAAASGSGRGHHGGIFGHGPTKSVSSLVRLALSSNFPSGLLNAAQSYPTLGPHGHPTGKSKTSHSFNFVLFAYTGFLSFPARPPTTGNSSSSSVAAAARHLAQMSESDQVSLEEFLESCRATSLLAELEDEEELPEAGEDEDGDGGDGEDDDDDDDDDDEYDENFDEEGFDGVGGGGSGHHSLSSRNGGGSSLLLGVGGSSGGRRKAWDDELVLKRKFSALIPAFDPRPGRTNVNQTSDFEVAPPPGDSDDTATAAATPLTPPPKEGSPAPTSTSAPPPPLPPRDDSTPPPTAPSLQLTLKGPNLPGIPDVEIDLSDGDWTIFKAVQTVIQSSMLGSKADKLRRLWEPTYVIIYKEGGLASRQLSNTDEDDEDNVTSRYDINVLYLLCCVNVFEWPKLTSFFRRDSGNPLPQLPVLSQSQCTMDEVLQLLRQLYIIMSNKQSIQAQEQAVQDYQIQDIFHSKKVLFNSYNTVHESLQLNCLL